MSWHKTHQNGIKFASELSDVGSSLSSASSEVEFGEQRKMNIYRLTPPETWRSWNWSRGTAGRVFFLQVVACVCLTSTGGLRLFKIQSQYTWMMIEFFWGGWTQRQVSEIIGCVQVTAQGPNLGSSSGFVKTGLYLGVPLFSGICLLAV